MRPFRPHPGSGINTITGEGLAAALDGASVVVDVSNSPNFEYATALEFFETSTRNLLDAEGPRASGTTSRCRSSARRRCPRAATSTTTIAGYFLAKVAQEALIKASSIPYSIVHATQFFEFIKSIADDATDGEHGPRATGAFQPMAADDVAKAVGSGRRRGARQRHRRDRRAGAVPVRRAGPASPRRPRTTRARS